MVLHIMPGKLTPFRVIVFVIFLFIVTINFSYNVIRDKFANGKDKKVVSQNDSAAEKTDGENVTCRVIILSENDISCKGYVIYLRKDEEIREDIDYNKTDNSLPKEFTAEKIKYCKVWKESGGGIFRLKLTEGDNIVFMSSAINDARRVVYEAK